MTSDSLRSDSLSEKAMAYHVQTAQTNDDPPVDLVTDDLAAKYLGNTVVLSKRDEKRLRRKVDFHICFIMCAVYAIQFADKAATGIAAIMGMLQDLELDGDKYSWVGSSFFLGYLIFEIPVNMMLQRFPLAKTTAVFICFWGIAMACTAAVQSFPALIVCRVLLGAFEGSITPSFIVLNAQWYKREEQFGRTCIWFGFFNVGTITGAGIAYGLYVHGAGYALATWRILFIILGLITILVGIVFWFWVPDSPATAWFLSEEERAAQVERIRGNQQGFGTRKFKKKQVVETFIDPRTYINILAVILVNIPNGGVTNFQTLLYRGMGFTVANTMHYTIAGGCVGLVGCLVTATVALNFFSKYRMIYANFCAAMLLVVLCIIAWVPSNSGKMASLMLFSWFQPIGSIALISCISSNAAGSTKKALSSALLMMGYCAGNLIGPQTFRASEAPAYNTAKTTMAATAAAALMMYLALTGLNIWENKRRDRKNLHLPNTVYNKEFADLTDMENPEFRYAL